MPALGIGLPHTVIYGLQGSGKGCTRASFLGGQGILVNKCTSTSLRRWRKKGALIVKALADSSETGTDVLSRYLDPSAVDQDMEASRVYRRVVYDEEQWASHRSSSRYARHIYTIFSSRIVRALGAPVVTFTFSSIAVSLWNEVLVIGNLPLVLTAHLPVLPFQLTAPALALLLVFRTNSSYGRFDEARKLWGSNVNRTRDVTRQALSWIQGPEDTGTLREFLRYTTAYPYTLKDHLVSEQDLTAELQGILHDEELQTVLASPHRPMHVLQMMSNCLARVQISDIQRSAMDENLTQFHDNTGSCERIFETPIPISYTRLISRLLVLWHVALPLGLWDSCNILTPVAVSASAAALFCIDEVAVIIEEPFSILALQALCDGMQSSIGGLVKSHAARTEVRVEEKPLAPEVPQVPEASEALPTPTSYQLVPLETRTRALAWSSIVANLVWSNFLLGLLWCVKLFYTEQQPPRTGPDAAQPKLPAGRPPKKQSSEGSDVYY